MEREGFSPASTPGVRWRTLGVRIARMNGVMRYARLVGPFVLVGVSVLQAQDRAAPVITPRLDTPQARVIVATLQPRTPAIAANGHATNRVLIYMDDGVMTRKEGEQST